MDRRLLRFSPENTLFSRNNNAVRRENKRGDPYSQAFSSSPRSVVVRLYPGGDLRWGGGLVFQQNCTGRALPTAIAPKYAEDTYETHQTLLSPYTRGIEPSKYL